MNSPQSITLSVDEIGVCYKRKTGLFQHDHFWALENVSFDLHKGEALALVGRNGAGKSTLLKVLCGIITPDRGSINHYNNTISLLGLLVGFNHNLSGRENAVMNAMLQGMARDEIISRLNDIEDFSGLKGFFDQPVRTYSAGMRTRLRFSIAIQVNPNILLIDEVLGVGDAEFSKKSGKIIHELIESDQTVLVVSHNLHTLKQLCSRAVWVEDGKTKMIGTAATVLDAYSTEIAS